MNENTNAMPPEEQAENDRDARAEELESTFSYDGYQVVRKELFAHLRDPAIVIRKDSITFNTACITGLEDCRCFESEPHQSEKAAHHSRCV